MVLYLLTNAAFLAVLPLPALAAAPLAAASVATVVFGAQGGLLVQALIAVALPSAIVANTLMASRVAFALGQDRLAPVQFARVNTGGTPHVALIATSIVTALFLLTGTFERVISICSVLFVAGYAMSFASVFVLRHREPGTARPYRAWGHPVTTGLVLLGSIAFLVGTVIAEPTAGIVAAIAVALSYPVYRVITRARRD
jgi:APA family basic amino acid/polyamine antiporter